MDKKIEPKQSNIEPSEQAKLDRDGKIDAQKNENNDQSTQKTLKDNKTELKQSTQKMPEKVIKPAKKLSIWILIGGLAILLLGSIGTYLVLNQTNYSKITFENGEIDVYKSNSLYSDPLKLGEVYETVIVFDLVNTTNETQTIDVVINLKYVALKESGNFQGVQFSSFQSDGTGENTTVILSYDLTANSTTTKEIVITFYPTAVTSNMIISVTPDSKDEKIEYKTTVIMGQN